MSASTKLTTSPNYLGGCPECGGNDGYLNVGRGHVMVCATHRVRWSGGYNLFSSWEGETEDQQRAAFERVADFRVVTPLPWDGSHPDSVNERSDKGLPA